MITSPLEQFNLFPLINMKVLSLDVSMTNFLVINLIALAVSRYIYLGSIKHESTKKQCQRIIKHIKHIKINNLELRLLSFTSLILWGVTFYQRNNRKIVYNIKKYNYALPRVPRKRQSYILIPGISKFIVDSGIKLCSYSVCEIPEYFKIKSQFGISVEKQLLGKLNRERSLKGSYLPLILTIFNLIIFSNLIGLAPYTFTSTSQLFVTFTLSFSVFIGVNIMTFRRHKLKSFSLFLPANTPIALSIILMPLEFISHVIKPISLGIRLFTNLMAGHVLLKIVAWFAWGMLFEGMLYGAVITLTILVILMGLEFGVALIQGYVFVTLSCIYIKDGIQTSTIIIVIHLKI